MAIARIELPPKLVPLFTTPDLRFRGARGGRGSGKSFSFAKMAAIRGYSEPLRILCARELQKSIKDSVHAEVVRAIESEPWLAEHYEWGESYIRGKNGTEFIFRGLRHNYREIKSMSGVGLCWVEEAEAVSEESWTILIPTIRAPGSEIWASWNPEAEDSPVMNRFVNNPLPRSMCVEINWRDNPWFPTELESDRVHMQATDPDLYAHVWEGQPLTRTDAQIMAGKWSVQSFAPSQDWEGPYLGADWGFSQDPTTLTKNWIHDEVLYIEYESWGVGIELDQIAPKWQRDIPGSEAHTVRGDCSRPETINYVSRHGYPKLIAAEKWAGSVEDGISHLRSYRKIIIHPRCEYTAQEFRLYSYKIDRITGDILPTIIDAHNHCLAEGTLVTTDQGDIPIEQIQVGDRVLTRVGYKPVLWAGQTGSSRQVYTVTTRNGKQFNATKNHEVLTGRGFVRVDALRYNDSILALNQVWQSKQQKTSNALRTKNLFTRAIWTQTEEVIGFITNQLLPSLQGMKLICIDKFGLTTTAQFLKGFTSIIKMEILQTTQFTTLNALTELNTAPFMQGNGFKKIEKAKKLILKRFDRLLKNGILQTRDESCTPSWLKILSRKIELASQKHAINAINLTQPIILQRNDLNFVPTLVRQNGDELSNLITLTEYAQFAKTVSEQANTVELKLVVDYVAAVSCHDQVCNVYDLTVDDQHEFFANGILVHNCIDAIRYSLSSIIRGRSSTQNLYTPKPSTKSAKSLRSVWQ